MGACRCSQIFDRLDPLLECTQLAWKYIDSSKQETASKPLLIIFASKALIFALTSILERSQRGACKKVVHCGQANPSSRHIGSKVPCTFADSLSSYQPIIMLSELWSNCYLQLYILSQTCSAWVLTLGGNSPWIPKACRSSKEKPMPLNKRGFLM